jgi:hypothetical protein
MALRKGPRLTTALKLVVLVALLATWVLIPHPLGGPVVITLSNDRGIHLGDLIGLGLGLGVVAVVA